MLSFGIISIGCSGSDSPSVDAGKKDGGGGKGGSGGSAGAGGSGSGGSANGGNSGNGGSSNTGGSASGGSTGTGGSANGGSSGTGGSASGGSSGTGGSGTVDGGNPIDTGVVDGGSDAADVSIGNNDGPLPSDDGGSVDTGNVILLDSGAIDQAIDAAEGIDMTIVRLDAERLDAEIDTTPAVDLAGVDATNPIRCSEVKIIVGAQNTGFFGTKDNFCFATCDDISGWGFSNSSGRTLMLVNGQPVDVASAGSMPLPTPKVQGKYTVFQINGSDAAATYASIYWWGTPATSCEAPAGGFGLN